MPLTPRRPVLNDLSPDLPEGAPFFSGTHREPLHRGEAIGGEMGPVGEIHVGMSEDDQHVPNRVVPPGAGATGMRSSAGCSAATAPASFAHSTRFRLRLRPRPAPAASGEAFSSPN